MIHNIIDNDTIAALATPNGRGGIAVIKISGPRALSLANAIFKSSKSPSLFPRTLLYGHIHDGSERIDEVLLCYMPAPKSYTGEDVVEIQSHGGNAVADTVLSLLGKLGARSAEPGEFTRRAFLNGRIDLVQAESVMEVVNAESREHLRQASRLMNGRFSACLQEILDLMHRADTLLTMNIDFSDQDQGEINHSTIRNMLTQCLQRIDSFLRSTDTGRRVRQGVTVVLTGPVNSGKSSLFNALLGRKRALVNARPGTTRDWIEERIELGGYPVNLIDTAGVRETADEIERDGVAESLRLVDEADIVIHLSDPSLPTTFAVDRKTNPNTLTVFSKSDLIPMQNRTLEGLYVSSMTGDGVEQCKSLLVGMIHTILSLSDSTPPLLIERHRQHLDSARFHTDAAILALDTWSEEIASFELKLAEKEIQKLTGKYIDTDVLDTVFKSFCIGK